MGSDAEPTLDRPFSRPQTGKSLPGNDDGRVRWTGSVRDCEMSKMLANRRDAEAKLDERIRWAGNASSRNQVIAAQSLHRIPVSAHRPLPQKVVPRSLFMTQERRVVYEGGLRLSSCRGRQSQQDTSLVAKMPQDGRWLSARQNDVLAKDVNRRSSAGCASFGAPGSRRGVL